MEKKTQNAAMWGFHYLQFTSFACSHTRSVCIQKQWQEPFAKYNLVLRLWQMHVESEAPVNEPQHGGKPSTVVSCDCRRPRKPLVQHRGNRHFSKDEAILQDTQTLNGTPKKMLASLPSLEEPKSPKGIIKKKGAGGWSPATPMCWALTCLVFPSSRQDHLHFTDGEIEACPRSDRSWRWWCRDLDPPLTPA